MTSTVAGITRTVSPSRLALAATPLVLSGDGDGAASVAAGVGAADRPVCRMATRVDTRARFDPDEVRLTGSRCGSVMTTGPSWLGCCPVRAAV